MLLPLLTNSSNNPHLKKIIAGYNPWHVDREGAGLLGLDWNEIGHIAAGISHSDSRLLTAASP